MLSHPVTVEYVSDNLAHSFSHAPTELEQREHWQSIDGRLRWEMFMVIEDGLRVNRGKTPFRQHTRYKTKPLSVYLLVHDQREAANSMREENKEIRRRPIIYVVGVAV